MPGKELTIEQMKAEILARQNKEPSIEQMKADILARQASRPEVIQEQHPDIGIDDRFYMKNFGNDKGAINYLKKKGLDAKVIGDQLVAKRPEEKDYRVVDPKGFDWQDIPDVATDVGSSLGTGAAATLASLAGAAGSLGVGALPAGIAAGGAAGLGLEALKQKIGQSLGVQTPGYDGTDLAISTVLGGAPLGILGGGGTKAEIKSIMGNGIKKGLPWVLEKMGIGGDRAVANTLRGLGDTAGLTKEAARALAEKTAYESQRGVSKYFPELAGGMTGVKPETIRSALEGAPAKLKEFVGMSGDKPASKLAVAEKIRETGGDLINQQRSQIFDATTGVTEGLHQEVGQALEAAGGTLRAGKYEAIFDQEIASLRATGRPINLQKATDLEAAKRSIFVEGVDEVSAKNAMDIKNELGELADYKAHKDITPSSDIVEKVSRKAWRAMTDDLTPLIERADVLSGGQGQLMKKYRDNEEFKREILKYFKTDAKTESTLAKLDKPKQKAITRLLNRMDRDYGTNIAETAKVLDVEATFGKPAWNPLSGGGAPATYRGVGGALLGSYAGSLLGSQMGGAPGGYVGGGLGLATGAAAFSPAALRPILKGLIKAKETGISDAVRAMGTAAARTGAPASAWQYISQGGGK